MKDEGGRIAVIPSVGIPGLRPTAEREDAAVTAIAEINVAPALKPAFVFREGGRRLESRRHVSPRKRHGSSGQRGTWV